MPGFELIGKEEEKEVMEVLATGVFMRYGFAAERKGVFKVKEFEEAFTKRCRAGYALGVTSGSAALKVALTALDVCPGDEVIVPAFDFIATYEAVLEVGAIPVMAEIDESLNLDPGKMEERITPQTKAVIPVHMCGAAADIEAIVKVARRRNLSVLEDVAQACGGTFRGKALGTFGDMGIFSLDYYKTITTGEGGMIITDSKSLYDRSDWYHDHGHDHNPNVGRADEGRSILGFNFRMNELQGALGLAQLRKLDFIVAEQLKNKARIKEVLKSVPGITFRKAFDSEGDTATFLGFMLPDEKSARAFHGALKSEKVDAIYYRDNAWHWAPNWEHLIAHATANSKSFPFSIHKGKVRYDAEMIPQSDRLIRRTIFFAVPVKLPEEKFAAMAAGITRAAKAL